MVRERLRRLRWPVFRMLLLLLVASCRPQPHEETRPEAASDVSPTPEDRPGDCPVARVGGTYIYYSDLVRASRSQEKPAAPSPELTREQLVYGDRYTMLDQLVARETLRQEAEQMGIQVTDQEVHAWLQATGPWGTSEVLGNYYPWLLDLSPEDFRSELKVDMMVFRAVQQRMGELDPVTDSDVRAFYEENRDTLRTDSRAEGFVLLIKKEGRSREEALQRINEIRASLAEDLEQADSWDARSRIFASYVRQYSEHHASDMGGYWSVSSFGGEDPERVEFLKIAFQAPLRTLSEVYEMQSGFFFTMLDSRRESQLVPYEMAQDKLWRLLTLTRSKDAKLELYQSLKEKYRPQVFRENIMGCGAGIP